MSVFAISDPHLPGGAKINKSMSVFGSRWKDHQERLKKNWHLVVSDNDTVIIPGDISWAMSLDDALEDLFFIDSLPGKKILGKGNHDFWWSSVSKMNSTLLNAGIHSISFLQNNAYRVEEFIICGTRGWFLEASAQAEIFDTDHEKLAKREAMRLSLSIEEGLRLSGGNASPLRVFLHFPAVLNGETSSEIFDVLSKYGIDRIYFGHIHDPSQKSGSFVFRDKTFTPISADVLDFMPLLVR